MRRNFWATHLSRLAGWILTARYERQQRIRQRTGFGLLPEPRKRRRAFAISVFVNCFAMALFILISLAHYPEVKPETVESVNLTFERPAPKLPRPKAPRVRLIAPRLQTKSTMSMASLQMPKIAALPRSIVTPRQVKVGSFASATTTIAANHSNSPRLIKVGGFGNPMGVRANPDARDSRLQAPMLGSFGGVPGATDVGSGHRGGSSAGVRLVGFGGGVGGGAGTESSGHGIGNGTGNGTGNGMQPVTVTAGARPIYTPEARAAHVEGEVILRVRFTANGQVEILGVVQPLGHGLDQSAENAVRQYRFTPATRNGQPVDQTTTVHVRFQLAA